MILSCDLNDQSSPSRTDEQIITLLKNDLTFQEFNLSRESIRNKVLNEVFVLEKRDLLLSATNFKEIVGFLNLPENLVEDFERNSQDQAKYLFSNYPELLKKSEVEIYNILASSEIKPANTELFKSIPQLNFRILDACDDQFADDFNRIHHNYDFQVVMCLGMAGVSGYPGVFACEGMAMANMLIQMGQAMDSHTICKNQQL